MTEEIQWIDVSEELPDSGSEVLVCFERNDCIDRDVAIAGYDDSYEEGSHWQVDGGLGVVGDRQKALGRVAKREVLHATFEVSASRKSGS